MDSSILLQTFFVFATALVMTAVAYRYGFFAHDFSRGDRKVRIFHFILVFGVHIGLLLLVGFGLVQLFLVDPTLYNSLVPWNETIAYVLSLLAAIGMSFLFGPDIAQAIWNNGKAPRAGLRKSFRFGILSWLVSFPWAQCAIFVATLLVTWVLGQEPPEFEQDAIAMIKAKKGNPVLFGALLLTVMALVPVLEEILFRGFLQTSLLDILPTYGAIALSSLVFSLLHVSDLQGIGNLQLVPGLFVISCFMGYVYEREKNLFAPIGLHMAVNTISTTAVLLENASLF